MLGAMRAIPRSLRCVVASPDGRWFATGGEFDVQAWSTADVTHEPPLYFKHTNVVPSLAFSPDGGCF